MKQLTCFELYAVDCVKSPCKLISSSYSTSLKKENVAAKGFVACEVQDKYIRATQFSSPILETK